MITAISELLTDEDRTAIGGAFGVPPVSQFVSTEGLAGCTRPGDAVMRFATDTCIVELVDARNQPVADGTASAKVLVTNLHNHTQPLIRYELTDRFIRHPAAGDPYLHAAVEGRQCDAADARHGRRECERSDPHTADVDTSAPCGLSVTANGIEIPAEPRFREKHGQCDKEN